MVGQLQLHHIFFLEMVSQGYVFKKDKNYLWTFASYDENEAVFSDRNCFPIGCIVSMTKIEV